METITLYVGIISPMCVIVPRTFPAIADALRRFVPMSSRVVFVDDVGGRSWELLDVSEIDDTLHMWNALQRA